MTPIQAPGETNLTAIRRMRVLLSKMTKRSRLGRVLLDHYPRTTQFADCPSLVVPGRVRWMFFQWQNNAGLKSESHAAFDAYEGGDFLDVGAFHGWYSWLLAPKACPGDQLISFEPDTAAYPTLLYNLSVLAGHYEDLSILPIPRPVGDGLPVVMIHPGGDVGHPQFGSAEAPRSADVARTLKIDDLVATLRVKPSFIKVDVEGAEMLVLRGMGETLAQFRPRVLLETHPKWQPDGVAVRDIHELLRHHGYSSTDIDASDVAVRQLWLASAR